VSSSRTESRDRRLPLPVLALAVIVGFALTALAVVRASSAAFTATTVNGSDTWNVGTVALTDDDAGVAMFTATGVKPSSTGTKCILVTYNGSLAATVKLYTQSESTTNAADASLNLLIEAGTGGTTSSCAGFAVTSTLYNSTLSSLASSTTNFATGLGTWAPSGSGQTTAYRFTWTFSSSAPNTTQGGSAAVQFTWEAQNS
jgi:hypothetical protein